MREIANDVFAARYDEGAFVVDVREPTEYVSGQLPGAQLIPMSEIPLHAHTLPRGEPVYVICETGHRSDAVATFLARAGVDAWSVAGGIWTWVRSGRPLVVATG